jgi:hypothetical protein
VPSDVPELRPGDVLAQNESTRNQPPSAARRWLTAGLVVALLAAIVVHFARSREDLASIRLLSLQVLAMAGVLQLLSQACLNASLLLPLQRHVARLGFWELYLVRTGGFFVGSMVPIAGGFAVRLAYLRKRGLTYLDFTWATLFSNVLALAAGAALASGALMVLWLSAGPLPASVIGVTFCMVAISLVTASVFQYAPQLTGHRKLQKWVRLSGMKGFTGSGPLAARVFGMAIMRHALNFVTLGLLYHSLSREPSAFLAGGLVYALTSPVRMINITPSNVGVTEWFVAVVGRLVAFDVTIGLIVSLAFRGVALVAQMMGALFGSAWLAVRSKA